MIFSTFNIDAEMMTMMMSQNMQLQQLLLQQMIPLSAGPYATESTEHR